MSLIGKAKKALSLPPEKVVSYIVVYLRQWVRKIYFELGLINLFKKNLDSYFLKPTNEVYAHFLNRDSFFGNFWINYLIKNSENKKELLGEADKLCDHWFNLLGSGEKKLGEKINWLQDFKTGRTWPLKWAFDLSFGEGDGTDIKVPWELSRFYHASFLAKAYVISKDRKYAQEFKKQVLDWIDKNPVYLGPNWMNAMEAAIRICNLILAYEIFKSAEKEFKESLFDDDFTKKYLQTLIDHGNYIFANLEDKGTKSNHFISDLVGLVYIGAIYPEIKFSKTWLDYALDNLENEVINEVYEDGVDYEASIYYHRLVAELVGHAGLVIKLKSLKMADIFWHRLGAMFDFTRNYIKPNGLAPVVGDCDDGRLHFIFDEKYFDWNNRNHTHILELQEILFGKEKEILLASKLYSKSQIVILRNKDLYVFVDAGNVGQGGNGGHAHNDIFSFEYNYFGKDFIIDAGNYCYTTYPKERNLFRSTRMHNTVMIDNEEQNRFKGELLFTMHEDGKPTILKWETSSLRDYFEGEHYGYERLPAKVIHKRYFDLNKRNNALTIKDNLSGKGAYAAEWNFHFAPAVIVKEVGRMRFSLINEGVELFLKFNYADEIRANIKNCFVSFKYGQKIESKKLVLEMKGEGSLELVTEISPK